MSTFGTAAQVTVTAAAVASGPVGAVTGVASQGPALTVSGVADTPVLAVASASLAVVEGSTVPVTVSSVGLADTDGSEALSLSLVPQGIACDDALVTVAGDAVTAAGSPCAFAVPASAGVDLAVGVVAGVTGTVTLNLVATATEAGAGISQTQVPLVLAVAAFGDEVSLLLVGQAVKESCKGGLNGFECVEAG